MDSKIYLPLYYVAMEKICMWFYVIYFDHMCVYMMYALTLVKYMYIYFFSPFLGWY